MEEIDFVSQNPNMSVLNPHNNLQRRENGKYINRTDGLDDTKIHLKIASTTSI